MRERVNGFIDFVIELFLQDFKPFKRLIMNLIDLTFELFYDQSNSDMADTLHRNIDKIGDIFGVNPELLQGFVGILSGDYHALAAMAAPVADISPSVIT